MNKIMNKIYSKMSFILALAVCALAVPMMTGCDGKVAVDVARLTAVMEEGRRLGNALGGQTLRDEIAPLLKGAKEQQTADRAQYDLDSFYSYLNGYSGGGGAEVLLSISEVCGWRMQLLRSVDPYLALMTTYTDSLTPASQDTLSSGKLLWQRGIDASTAVCSADISGVSAEDVFGMVRGGIIIASMFGGD